MVKDAGKLLRDCSAGEEDADGARVGSESVGFPVLYLAPPLSTLL